MALRFWSKCLIGRAFRAALLFTGVLPSPLKSTPVVETLWRRKPSEDQGGASLVRHVNRCQHGVQPLREQLMRFFKVSDRGHASRFPAVGDS